ncbi:MAG: hypothetical protein PHE43_00360 [Candidatus Nanoarchaeia archaeon]|nr:hypothetical protein [Candidatus Nanoarchaeia archaeon]
MSKNLFLMMIVAISILPLVACNGEDPIDQTVTIRGTYSGLLSGTALNNITVTAGGFSTTTNSVGTWELTMTPPVDQFYTVTFTDAQGNTYVREVRTVPLDTLRSGYNETGIESEKAGYLPLGMIDAVMRQNSHTQKYVIEKIQLYWSEVAVQDTGMKKEDVAYYLQYGFNRWTNGRLGGLPVEYLAAPIEENLASISSGVSYFQYGMNNKTVQGDEDSNGIVRKTWTELAFNPGHEFPQFIIHETGKCVGFSIPGSAYANIPSMLHTMDIRKDQYMDLTEADIWLVKIHETRGALNTSPDSNSYR